MAATSPTRAQLNTEITDVIDRIEDGSMAARPPGKDATDWPVLEPREPDPKVRRKWLALMVISTVSAGIAGYLQYHWSIEFQFACYDGGPPSEPVEINGATFLFEGMKSALIVIVVICLATTLLTHLLDRRAHLAILVAIGIGTSMALMWIGIAYGTYVSDRCPAGLPPTWPTWLPL